MKDSTALLGIIMSTLLYLGIWGGVLYLVLHFVFKYW